MNQEQDDRWWRFLRLCLEVDTPEQLDAFFTFFLTSEERSDLASRYLLVKELVSGEKTQRKIAADLGVSISKITRGSNAMKILDNETREWLKVRMA
jgi:TrpR family transcriptional regulator, trp operon repressor